MAGAMGSRSSQNKSKTRLPPFVPLFQATLDSEAWRATSHGAKALYIALKRRVMNYQNIGYLSHRDASAELRSSRRKVAEWFEELEQYGFIVLVRRGSLGVDGRGMAPHWRLTELGATSKASADGQFEPATADFFRWDRTKFIPASRRKKQNPGSYGVARVTPTGEPVVVPTGLPPNGLGGFHGEAIGNGEGGAHGVAITSITTGVEPTGSLSKASTEDEITRAPDPRIIALAKRERVAKRKPWSKPTILSDEPRDSTLYPPEEGIAA